MKQQFESFIFIAILGTVGLFGIWLQNLVLEDDDEIIDSELRHDPDYYIENFTATGLDKNGARRFVIKAKRMAHFPDDDTALLDFPEITQFQDGAAPRHTYADSGWMNASGDEVIMTDNVRVVVESTPDSAGGTIKTKRLRVLLTKNEKETLF